MEKTDPRLEPPASGEKPPEEPDSILIVDDSEALVGLLQALLTRRGYQCTTALNAKQALAELERQPFDLVLSDMNMPQGMSGIELLQEVYKNHPDTAAILVTAEDDPQLGQMALDMGAYGYIIKPFNNTELIINVSNALHRGRLRRDNKNHRAKLQQAVLERTRELMETISRLELAEQRLLFSQEETIERLARAAEFRDNETAQHIQRMSRYCELLAHCAGLDDERCKLLRAASPMHDIGKIGITDSILLKPGKLTPEEFEVMKGHAEIGYRILSGSESELLNLGSLIARTHHEKYDGSGYPFGLAGEDIPLEGRITAIADVFDALTSERVYKKAFLVEDAVALMKENSGSHFDAELLELFLDALPEVMKIKARFLDD